MKILSIITSFTAGGAEVLVSNLSAEFVAAGHDSTVVALASAQAIGNDPATEAEQRDRIARHGGHSRVLDLGRSRGIVSGARALRRIMREEQPDVIHAHTARAVPMLWLARASAPVVLTHHNSKLSFPPAMFRLFDRVVHSYVAISQQCDHLLAGHVRRPVTRIVNATGPGFLADASRTGPSSPASLLAVGALTPQKNYPMLIQAAAIALAARPDLPFSLRIAGNGALREELQAMIEKLGAAGFIELLGDRSDIPQLMAQADIFVNSSHYEGMSIATLEALQSALPVLATEVAGTTELIADGHNGVLVPPDDPAAFALAIARLLDGRSDYAKLSAGALETGRNYRLDTCAAAHLDLYHALSGADRA